MHPFGKRLAVVQERDEPIGLFFSEPEPRPSFCDENKVLTIRIEVKIAKD